MDTPSNPPNSELASSNESGPCCLITGGSAGIGLATAKQFAAQGYDILICGRDANRLDAALDEIQNVCKGPRTLITVECDLSQPGSAEVLAETAIEKLGRVDVLVNNAGLAPLAMLDEMTDEQFESTLQVNVRSVFYLTRSIWKHMKAEGRGVLVNVSSLAAIDPFPGFSMYGATKAWIDLMTTALASEGAEHGIRTYSVRPGAVETQLLRRLFPDFPAEQCVSPDDVAQQIWNCVAQPEQFTSGQPYAVTNQTS